MAGARVGDVGLAHVCNMTSLRCLHAGRLQPAESSGFKHLSNLLSLRELDVSWNRNLDSNFCAVIARLTELKRVNLSKTAVDDSGCQHLMSLVNLEFLNLPRNRSINGSGCRAGGCFLA